MMRYESLYEPVSDDEPCGPDLDEIGDDDYLNYALPAEEKLPARYIDTSTGAVFDRNSIDIKAEVKQISGLLERSRDLRLLTLEARFHILSGHTTGFAECVETIAGLLERFWEHVHPGSDGDMTMRQNTLAALDGLATSVLPFQHATLIRDKRRGGITLRHYLVATGEAPAREDESLLDASAILEALSSTANAEAVDTAHAELTSLAQSLESIRSTFIEQAGHEFAPSFDQLSEALTQTLKLITTARSDLGGEEAAAEDGDAEAEGGEDGAAVDGDGADETAAAPGAVSDPAAAAAALFAIESYFANNEPSGPSLILVHQARMLIGRPLVEALEALLPESAERATIVLDQSRKFELAMGRLRVLSESVSGLLGEGLNGGPHEFTVESRAQASSLLSAVETYFRSAEPSSPIPLLLVKARGFLNKDFASILNDIVPKEEQY